MARQGRAGRKVETLLTVGNPKTAKGESLGILTGILHLAPATLSVGSGGFNTCPKATPQCAAACLNTAGRGGILKAGETTNTIQRARIRRTVLFASQRSLFWRTLMVNIDRLVAQAERHGLRPAVRLNGTSDLLWERIPVIIDGERIADNIMALYPDVQFYDYTKWAGRAVLPANYHLTFSRSEQTTLAQVKASLQAERNVAVVFSTKRGEALPSFWHGAPVHDGDATDVRFMDPRGVVVGLRAKGKARKGHDGFVVAV